MGISLKNSMGGLVIASNSTEGVAKVPKLGENNMKNMKGLTKIKIWKLLQMALTLVVLTISVGAAQDYKQTNLVSDTPGLAQFTDQNLVNPWGLARSSTSPWWISDNGMGVSTLYNDSGNPFPIDSPLIVTMPPDGATPTGVVFNAGTGFEVNPGEPAKFIFASEDGIIAAWNSSVNETNAIVKVNDSTVYKGLTIDTLEGQDYLYVANFRNGTIDTFDSGFNKTSLGDNFKDMNIPDGFAPFNIVNINGDLFVTFAMQDAAKHDDVAGAGLGFVDKFSPDGTLLMRLENGSWLNSPWGVTLASDNFGELSNNLLVGNFGSGQIATFDPGTGNFSGFVQSNGSNINISGLWALVFGNDATAGPSNVLFFTAGIEGEQHGLFGTISQNVTVSPSASLTVILNDTMDGTSTPLVDNFAGAVLLDTLDNIVSTATIPDNMTAQFSIGNIAPGDYFVEVNGLTGDHLPTRIDSNSSDITQFVGKRLRNSVIGSISNPTYRIKVYPSGNPPVVNSSHPVVNYTTDLNESIYNFVIVSGNESKIEIRTLDTSEELNNFSTNDTDHNGLSVPFQTWILGDTRDSTGNFVGNHGHLYNASADVCIGCHTNLGTKPDNFSDVSSTNGWCFRCHNGPEGPSNGFFDVRLANENVAPPTPSSGKIWKVNAGGQTQDMAIQGMAFYPGIITVNVGDTVKWTVKGNFHTISFLSGQVPPESGSPESLSPYGESGYDGTGFASSGILATGENYSLTFTKPGIFAYQCLIHSGMQGVVIVQENGSNYPFTQREYNKQARADLTKDLDVGRKSTDQVDNMVKSIPGPNGTKNWQTFIDIVQSEMVKIHLNQMNGSGVRGSAILDTTNPESISVNINVSGLEPNSEHLANIKIGTCKTPGDTVYAIGNIAADSNGDASFATDINVTPPSGIMNRGWIVDVDDASTGPITCGNVVKHDASRMRFATDTLKIHQGDTVTWTQLDAMEIHTVSFLADNQTSPDLLLPGFVINPDVAGPSGTDEYNGTGFFNSGILVPGSSYSLTFTEPGIFKYECLIHDEMNMIGYIKVRPKDYQRS